MQKVINQIMEMDKKARDIKNSLQQEKITYEKEILKSREKLYEDYLLRARQRVEQNSAERKKRADEDWEKIKANHKKSLLEINKVYKKNKDKWVEEIVNRVINE